MDRKLTITLRHRLEYLLFRTLDLLLAPLPRNWVQALGRGLGSLVYVLDIRHRRIARENLRLTDLRLSKEEERAIAKACFRYYGELLLSLIPLRRATPEELDQWIQVEGLEHFDAVRARGVGFIQLTGHYGNWEAIALVQSRHGRTLAVIGRSLDNPLLDLTLNAFRGRFGNRVIAKEGAVRETLKALKRGEGVGFLLDQDALTNGVWVHFLGAWASTFSTAGNLASRYNLPVLPVFSWPEEDGRLRVRFEEPFELPRTGDLAKDTWVATQLMAQRIEAQIRKDPRWWFWMHRRFKTRPSEGNPLPAPLPPKEWIESLSAPTL